MSDTCTILTQNNSYKIDATYAALILQARERGDAFVSVVPNCDCGSARPPAIQLAIRDIVSVIGHGPIDLSLPEPTNVIPFRR